MRPLRAYSFDHIVCSFEICQHGTNVSLVIGPLLKGAETPLHRLHFDRYSQKKGCLMSVVELRGSDREN